MPHDILPVVSGNNLRKIWQKLLATFPTRTQVITLIEENAKLKKEVVQELPTENINTNCIYLVPDPNGTARNVYNEYMYIIDEQTHQGNWELIGTTRVDMSQYYTKTQTDRMLLDKQNRTDNDLQTESKTIAAAINEVFTTLGNFISSAGAAITSLGNRVTKLEPIQGTTADIMQRFNDGEIPEGYYAESWDDDVAEFAIPITSEQYEALTEAQKTNFNYLITDGLPAGMLLMDNYPRAGSNNAVKSKGLYEKFHEVDEVLDGDGLLKKPTTFESLSSYITASTKVQVNEEIFRYTLTQNSMLYMALRISRGYMNVYINSNVVATAQNDDSVNNIVRIFPVSLIAPAGATVVVNFYRTGSDVNSNRIDYVVRQSLQ